jgi:pyridoxine kinase
MGDQGRLYVHENVIPAYKGIIRDADLILPNQFEAEYVRTLFSSHIVLFTKGETRTLSGVTIQSFSSLANAISMLHINYQIPHIIVTSIRLTPDTPSLSVIGSTARADKTPRLFKIDVPALPCFFSGTGDMFAALIVVRLREACLQAGVANRTSWTSPDEVPATELPLAKAAEKVLASIQMVLEKTLEARDAEIARISADGKEMSSSAGIDAGTNGESQRRHLAETKAAEVRLIRNVKDLWQPEDRYKATELEV